MFELYYLPIHLELGQEQPDMPGMLVRLPPRKAQRSRAGDILIALLTPFEGTHPGARTLESMLEEAAGLYYKSRGSATNGLRETAEHLNHLFLKYNAQLQGNRKDGQIFAYLNLAVLREDLLYLIHVGSTSTYLLAPERMQPFKTDTARGRGLGISRTAPLAFFQTRVEPESLLLMCANPPPTWPEDVLTPGSRLSINLLRRRIIHSTGATLRAGMVQFKAADQALVHRLRPKAPLTADALVGANAAESAAIAETQAPDAADGLEALAMPEASYTGAPADETAVAGAAALESPTVEPAVAESGQPAGLEEETGESAFDPLHSPTELLSPSAGAAGHNAASSSGAERPDLLTGERIALPAASARPRSRASRPGEQAAEPPAHPVEKVRRTPRSQKKPDPVAAYQRAARQQARRKMLAARWQGLRAGGERLGRGLRSLAARLLPGYAEDSPQISAGMMLFISLVVPLVVVAIAITVYMRNGREQQHQAYLQQALVFAAEARQSTSPEAERSNWNQALHWLDLAEEYRVSEPSALLRRQAGAALDVMDGVERLDFRPLLSYGFSSTLNFTRIAANDTEVYLLDSSQGRVVRLFLTGQGYELDNEFACGPGASGARMIGDLLDIIALPPGSPRNASLMAIDGSGNLLYCIPGAEAPVSGELLSPADGWGKIQAISYYQGTLYVLDSLYGAVFSYDGYNMEFGEEPSVFFDPERDESIPDLRRMIDLAAYGEDLYLLNENGTIARCTSGIYENYQTRCQDPAAFGDMRPGMETQTLTFPNAFFAQVQTALPPDPSLFLLDINTPSLYRFSLQLNLDRLFQPDPYADETIPDPPATAFAVSPARIVFLAFGHQVYYASLNR